MEALEKRDWGKVVWLCICDCGNLVEMPSNRLRTGNTRSCGCLRREKTAERMCGRKDCGGENNPRYKHGYGNYKNRLYRIYHGMIQRCELSSCPTYRYYGEKGIEICNKWRNNFLSFRDWAMGNGYRDDLVLDRIDNNKNYVPENCQWLTRSLHGTKSNHERWRAKRIKEEGYEICPKSNVIDEEKNDE